MRYIKRILRKKCIFPWVNFRCTWIFTLIFIACWIVGSQTKLMECLTDSLQDTRYILFLKSSSVKRGDIVAIQGHREEHVGTLKKWPYSKRVLGVPGDHIVRHKDGITVIPQESYSLSLLDKTSKGKPLTAIVPLDRPSHSQPSKTIPEGYLFVAGDNPQSFDSRYAEFGLVPISKIWGKAVCTW